MRATASKAARAFARAENALLVLTLSLLVAIPLLERLLRQFLDTGITGASQLVQHLCLILAMSGAAIAARERRLLAITTLSRFLPGRVVPHARALAASAAAAIACLLAHAGLQFLLSERSAGPEINHIAYGIQKWFVLIALPAGFLLIAVRILRHGGEGPLHRGIACLGTLLILLLAWRGALSPEALWIPALLLLVPLALLEAPLFTILGGAALTLAWMDLSPLSAVANDFYSLTTESLLPAIPLFTLAGYVLAESRASRRLVAVFRALVGENRAGPPLITVLVCAFFTSFTGGSGVTILALSPLLFPLLTSARCSERGALGLLAGSGSLGILLPPSLPVILYFIVANSGGSPSGLSLERLFLGGLLPCLLLMALLASRGALGIPRALPGTAPPESPWLLRLAGAVRGAIWELLLPVVALGSLFSGILGTPVAAAAATALYAILVVTLIRGDLSLSRDLPRILVRCGLLVGGVLLILGISLALTNCLILARVPDLVVEGITGSIESRWVFLIALNLFLLLAGCLMDIYSAIVVIVPLLIPLGIEFGIDPVHLAIIFLVNLELGYITPPIGLNLFLAAYRFERPVMEIARAALPFLAILLLGLLLVTYLPALSTWLPDLLLPSAP